MTQETSRVAGVAGRVRADRTVTGVETVESGNRQETRLVRFDDAEPIVVQRAPDPADTRVEARLLAAIDDRTSVPVAAPLGSGTIDGDGWLATPLVSGTNLHRSFAGLDPAVRAEVARAFGRYLAELHDAFRFESYGALTVADGWLVADPDVGWRVGTYGSRWLGRPRRRRRHR